MIAAFDANVLASASIRSTSAAPPAAIWDIWRDQGTFTLVVSQHVLDEVESTLRKRYFTDRLNPAEIVAFLGLLQSEAVVTPMTVQVAGVATHPEDDLVLSGAPDRRGRLSHTVTVTSSCRPWAPTKVSPSSAPARSWVYSFNRALSLNPTPPNRSTANRSTSPMPPN